MGYPAAFLSQDSDTLLSSLNPEQQRAVVTQGLPLLVLAGAGTGKTRVLTTRLAYILQHSGIDAHEVLAVTFSNKAAAEMRQRVRVLAGDVADSVWLGTFHAMGNRILRRYAPLIGYSSDFSILNADDQLRLMKQVIKENKGRRPVPPALATTIINRWKDRGLTCSDLESDLSLRKDHQDIFILYQAYEDALRRFNSMDFGDLILQTVRLLEANASALERFRQQFRHILVDEYQDTNAVQYRFLKLLSPEGRDLCCVGDDDQVIYSWRGAEVDNILHFEKDFPGAQIVRLEQNYRSTAPILAVADMLIQKNTTRLGKTLWTGTEGGAPVRLKGLRSSRDEAQFVAQDILRLNQQRGVAFSEIAILVRAGSQTREFEEVFIALGLPYRIVGNIRFYERAEVRDALAYLRVVAVPHDSLAFARVLNLPKRGLGKVFLQKLHDVSSAQSCSLFEAAREMVGKTAALQQLRLFTDLIARWHEKVETAPSSEILKGVLQESGYFSMLKEEKTPEAAGRLENLWEFVRALTDFPILKDFLDQMSLVSEVAPSARMDQISIITLHGAKGLEFEAVFLCGWEEGLFPHPRSLEDGSLDEERRLAYVGLTRAKRLVTITFSHCRCTYGRWTDVTLSRFFEGFTLGNFEVLGGVTREELEGAAVV
ncbi:MAG: UvrD-helicase domain-containing protein [Holosporales bacterium]|jgi:DNA helicase-2/ATP-dependent DNA helicase PcrA|nr:UvrD-helicase domain-containing protein [Holosporales bacterium]